MVLSAMEISLFYKLAIQESVLIPGNVIVFTMKQFSPLRDPTPYKKQGYDRRRVREQRPIILWCLNIPDMKHGFWFVSTPLMTLERSRLEEYFI